jgi:ADP-L-glycero-D-manno-heptose 6-epimerase
MHILVTGHRGFIGQNMVHGLAPDHKVTGYEWGDAPYSLDGVDWVIHLGGISSTTCTDQQALKTQNYDFTVNLVERCVQRNIPIQIASSASVYGTQNTTFKETDPVDPRTPYAKSKAAIEAFCGGLDPSSPVQLFRYFNVYGPHEDHKGDQASPQHKFAKEAEKTGRVRLFVGSKEFCRDFISVQQVVQIHKAFFYVQESGIWNVGSGIAMSFYEVALGICPNIEWISMPENLKSGYQKYTQADLTKLNQILMK